MTFQDRLPPQDPGPTRSRPHANLAALRWIVLFLFAGLSLRLVDMQLVRGDDYALRTSTNHLRESSILPSRGLILDRAGVQLVENVPRYSAVLIPEFLPDSTEDRRTIYLWIENNLAVPALQVDEMVRRVEEGGTEALGLTIKEPLTDREALLVEESSAHLSGLALVIEAGRNYAAGDYLSHVLGFIGPQTEAESTEFSELGYQLNEQVGKAGLESRYEPELRGDAGANATEVDAFGNVIEVLETVDPVSGNNLHLSIDLDLQQFIGQLLEDTRGESPVAAAVVMDANTGAVLALVSIPTYDNNLFGSPERLPEFQTLLDDPRRPLVNHALTSSAPGSTFKLVTASAALEYGNITPSTSRDISSPVLLVTGENGVIYPMRDWRAHGYLELTGAIAWSSNIYFFMASCGIPGEVKGLGVDVDEAAIRLGYYARAFGFGTATGIDIDAAEEDGIIPSPDWKRRVRAGPNFNSDDRDWYYADTCFMGVGQGDVLATPIQIAVMTAAVANGGSVLTPHVVSGVSDTDGNLVETIDPVSTPLPIDEQNLAIVRQGMLESVAYGAGLRGAANNVTVAGKTGTAEFGPERPDGTFNEHGWFTGFAPYQSPEIVVTVYFELGVGGIKAAPVASQIFDYYWENVRE